MRVPRLSGNRFNLYPSDEQSRHSIDSVRLIAKAVRSHQFRRSRIRPGIYAQNHRRRPKTISIRCTCSGVWTSAGRKRRARALFFLFPCRRSPSITNSLTRCASRQCPAGAAPRPEAVAGIRFRALVVDLAFSPRSPQQKRHGARAFNPAAAAIMEFDRRGDPNDTTEAHF